jgi:hypothetical protein
MNKYKIMVRNSAHCLRYGSRYKGKLTTEPEAISSAELKKLDVRNLSSNLISSGDLLASLGHLQ